MATDSDLTFDSVDAAYKRLSEDRKAGRNKSLLAKYLDDALFAQLKNKRTKHGSGLLEVIQSGAANPGSHVGVYAPDNDAYTVFEALFKQIIADYHKQDIKSLKQPAYDFGDVSRLNDVDPENKYIVSTRCRVARTVEKLPMNPKMTKENYLELEEMVKTAVKKFEGDLAGEYLSLATMSDAQKRELIDAHLLYKENDPALISAIATNHWPTGRGIFLSKNRDFLIWCGEEDHLRLISMQKGSDLQAVISRLKTAIAKFSEGQQFAMSETYGTMTFCPTNLGTSIRASFHIKLPQLEKNMELFQKITDEHHLQIRGIDGEGSAAKGSVFDISNKRRFGFAEKDVVDDMHQGAAAIIAAEKKLEKQ